MSIFSHFLHFIQRIDKKKVFFEPNYKENIIRLISIIFYETDC